MTVVGVVADTHCPEFLPELPARVLELLDGVDLILHAGDVGGVSTLDRLREVAPVEAVRGDHDPGLGDLPWSRELEIAGRRVALVHGNRSHLVEEPLTLLGTLTLGTYWPNPGLHGWLRRRFPAADVIVYGHTHSPAIDRTGGRLVFNPGGVYQVDREAALARLGAAPGWFEWSWLQVIRHRRRVGVPTVGRLVFDAGEVTATAIRLDG